MYTTRSAIIIARHEHRAAMRRATITTVTEEAVRPSIVPAIVRLFPALGMFLLGRV